MSSREERSAGPVIVINDVTYRSPEDMPAEARAIWDHYASKFEQQGVDWREQDRIVITLIREGKSSRQSIHIERRSANSGDVSNSDDMRRKMQLLAALKGTPGSIEGTDTVIDALLQNIGGLSVLDGKPGSSNGARKAIEDWRRSSEGSSASTDGPANSEAARATFDVWHESSKFSSTSNNGSKSCEDTRKTIDDMRRNMERLFANNRAPVDRDSGSKASDNWGRQNEGSPEIGGRPENGDDRRAISPVAMFLYVLCVVPLVGYAIPSNQPELLFAPNGVIYASFLLLALPCLWLALKDHRRREPVRALGLVAAALPLICFATFNGVAKLLHSVERQPGAVIATVAEIAGKAGCDSLAFQEFRALGDRVCVGSDLFGAVKVGGQIRITGNLSRYGIEPDRFEPVSEAAARFEDVE